MNRKSKFALQDDDDDNEATEVLTHGGSALSTLDDFQEDVSVEDEGDDSGCMKSTTLMYTIGSTWQFATQLLS